MSDYEMLNRRVAEKKAAQRKDALRRLAYLLGIVLAVMLVCVGLESIGFINMPFMVILVSGSALVGAFHAGRIWNGFIR